MSDLLTHIKDSFSGTLLGAGITNDDIVLYVAPNNIFEILEFLKNDEKCAFQQLIDICAVDYPNKEARFEIIYSILSLELNQRLRIKVPLAEEMPIHSVNSAFRNAVWYECEIFDMFGIYFQENPDLRRILMPDDFEGYPLRKDFSLTGDYQLKYDEKASEIVKEDIEEIDYTEFDFINNELTRGDYNAE